MLSDRRRRQRAMLAFSVYKIARSVGWEKGDKKGELAAMEFERRGVMLFSTQLIVKRLPVRETGSAIKHWIFPDKEDARLAAAVERDYLESFKRAGLENISLARRFKMTMTLIEAHDENEEFAGPTCFSLMGEMVEAVSQCEKSVDSVIAATKSADKHMPDLLAAFQQLGYFPGEYFFKDRKIDDGRVMPAQPS